MSEQHVSIGTNGSHGPGAEFGTICLSAGQQEAACNCHLKGERTAVAILAIRKSQTLVRQAFIGKRGVYFTHLSCVNGVIRANLAASQKAEPAHLRGRAHGAPNLFLKGFEAAPQRRFWPLHTHRICVQPTRFFLASPLPAIMLKVLQSCRSHWNLSAVAATTEQLLVWGTSTKGTATENTSAREALDRSLI